MARVLVLFAELAQGRGSSKGQYRHLAGADLARRSVAELAGVDQQAVILSKTPAGQPFARLGATGRFAQVSITHTDRLVAAAATLEPGLQLGIDAEKPERFENTYRRLLDIMLTPAEGTWVSATPPRARAQALAELWAAKEAYVKALGTGFTKRPSAYELPWPCCGNVVELGAGFWRCVAIESFPDHCLRVGLLSANPTVVAQIEIVPALVSDDIFAARGKDGI